MTSKITKSKIVTLPALIDPHVHFRVPGAEHKEDWASAATAALAGGVTTVIDMPNNIPPVVDGASLTAKKKTIDEQLRPTGIPLRYHLYLGATADNWKELKKCKDEIAGVKLFMGASTGDLLVDKLADQEKIFAEAARLGLMVAVHAEDDDVIRENLHNVMKPNPAPSLHSLVRSRAAAVKAVTAALALAQKYRARLYICHVSTAEEIRLIRSAKRRGVKVYAEVAPHHLFLDDTAYAQLGTLGQMNPPLRTPSDRVALWRALNDGTIDTIGTDHAPHTLEEKNQSYPASPSGVPGIETLLPLLLNAAGEKKISLKKISQLTHYNPQKIFRLPETGDTVTVDLKMRKTVKRENLKTKCGWSPYEGMRLTGWPVAVKINEQIFNLN